MSNQELGPRPQRPPLTPFSQVVGWLAGLDPTPFRGPEFTHDEETIELYWRVREGLHGLVGRLRPPGTALIVEDVCVPPARIAAAADEIRALLGEHGFLSGVAGHHQEHIDEITAWRARR